MPQAHVITNIAAFLHHFVEHAGHGVDGKSVMLACIMYYVV